mmetsp:Transcript_39943/g.76398  ORF Transcript_39943/g.76398 Transcript_39943/m.76398 type:complete len:222 (-) Transcript_39943:766-1431(-)
MRGVAGSEHAHAEGAPRPRPRGDARAAAGRRPGVVAASEPPPSGGDITLRPLQGLGGGVAERKQRAAEAGALGGTRASTSENAFPGAGVALAACARNRGPLPRHLPHPAQAGVCEAGSEAAAARGQYGPPGNILSAARGGQPGRGGLGGRTSEGVVPLGGPGVAGRGEAHEARPPRDVLGDLPGRGGGGGVGRRRGAGAPKSRDEACDAHKETHHQRLSPL